VKTYIDLFDGRDFGIYDKYKKDKYIIPTIVVSGPEWG
jgi:hypothetical protein